MSPYQQYFTGTNNQTCILPTTGVTTGVTYVINNLSTGLVTVQSSALNTIIILASGTFGTFTALQNAPTSNTHWNYWYEGVTVGSGKKTTFNNTITFSGVDSSTITFPATSTLASLGLDQTFTGGNTFNNANVFAGAVTMSIFNTTASNISFAGAVTGFTLGGTPTTTLTASYFANATASGATKTLNIGTGGVSGSTTILNIGASASTTTFNIYGKLTATTFKLGSSSIIGQVLTASDTGGTMTLQSLAYASGSTNGILSSSDWNLFNGKMSNVSPGANGNVMTSNGSIWVSSAPSGGSSGNTASVGGILYLYNNYGGF